MGTTINVNIGGTQVFGSNNSVDAQDTLGSLVPSQLPSEVTEPTSTLGNFLQGFNTGFEGGLMEGFKDGLQGALSSQTCPCEKPNPADSTQPAGGLTVDKASGDIKTPGGYTISQVGQFDWKVTGPDGKASEIWGDPHVKELGADGKQTGGFDFKKNATFVLGDGTRIDVATKPYGDGGKVTVTSGLTVSNGNDRVQVSGIDQGKGQVGDVTHDAFQHVNDAGGNQVFVEGQNAAQWTSGGKEILGDKTDGTPDDFKLGNDVPPLVSGQNGGTTGTSGTPTSGKQDWATEILKDVANVLKDLMPLLSHTSPVLGGSNPYYKTTDTTPSSSGSDLGAAPVDRPGYSRDNHLSGLGDAFTMIGDMFKVMGDIASLNDQLSRRPMFNNL